MIYFDHAATTPVDSDVIATITDVLSNEYGNPSSIYQRGRAARKLVDEARSVFARSIQANPVDIIVTSGATEANNTAILSTALALKERGKHLITTAVEHPSVLNPMQYLETQGFDVTYLPVDENGLVTADQVEAALRPDTILVSIIYGNNEVGSINPIKEIGERLTKYDTYFHTDAVQAYGSREIDVQAEHIDMLSVTAHKLNGPKGIGFLYRKNTIHLPHFIHGGKQENDKRAGTENTAYIQGFAKAVEKMLANREKNNAYKRSLRDAFIAGLEERGVEFDVNGMKQGGLPHILSLYLPAIQSDKFLIQCDLQEIMLSAGSACTAGSLEPSHVLAAMFGKTSPRIKESVRISFGKENTLAEVDVLLDLIQRLQQSN